MSDVFRTIPIRFLGHGHAFSAAFGPNIYYDTHQLLRSVGTGYIIAHAIHRGLHVGGNAIVKVIFDTLVFDFLASAVLPTILTYHVRRIMVSLTRQLRSHEHCWVWVPDIVSIASLLLTWQSIDELVDHLLDQTIR